MFGHAKVLLLAGVIVLAGCAGKQSQSMVGGNLFAQWCPTDEQLEADPGLVPIRWTHAESMQLGSYVSMVLMQEGESPPKMVDGSLMTHAGPVNAALGAGGLIGAAILFNPDPDQTTVNQEGGGAESNSKSGALAGSHSSSDASASNRNTNISTNINTNKNANTNKNVAINKPKRGRGPRH